MFGKTTRVFLQCYLLVLSILPEFYAHVALCWSYVLFVRSIVCWFLLFVLHQTGEYSRAFRQKPQEPMISLLVGLSYLQIACQKFAFRRNSTIVQVKQYGCSSFILRLFLICNFCFPLKLSLGHVILWLIHKNIAPFFFHECFLLPSRVYITCTETRSSDDFLSWCMRFHGWRTKV